LIDKIPYATAEFGMPFALYMLALAVFTQGTSEFMLAGLIPDIALDLHVSIPAAGLLTSAFAVGMVIGAPAMAILSLRWPRRQSLVGFLVVFIAAHVVGAITGEYAVLLASRFVGALANAGFWAVALATAASLVEPNKKGRATALVVGGVTIACIAGVPAGALLGQQWGWRSVFWAVALLSLPVVFAVLGTIPAGRPAGVAQSVRNELRALKNSRLLVTLLLGALINGAIFCFFTYLAPLLTDVTGLAAAWVPALLALFGIGSFLGITIGGRIADSRPVALIVTGQLALLAGWVVLALTAASPAATIVLVLVQGALSFATGSTLISRVFYVAPEAPTVGGGLATSAFNVGGAVGPWLGGVGIGAGLGLRSPLWVSAVMTALALAVTAVAYGRSRWSQRRTAEGFVKSMRL
jgi:DHA1 family chloramphenicol resistance protein-like MFS transporter